ncbi:hypothetical protein AO053_04235 [Haemophilus influenzae biotype aegyptius]|uniref:hypothetical protein n=2 Tax=Haemophilus influenzae TaxID=727 RepID=UPI0001F36909|nr:hypothetical protein [Haemophilus influenzae]QEQ61456.1 hypothetical protein F1539_03135 [Haemophilus influenzae biotype aegyptius]QEQ63045.1 hypothetical protein F1538_01800 [Haemophilus influenzae biotype aegyptius]QEQ65016.1 hypothetical protein F1537_02520 [Haemophilus influenzae biotype aegyptius]TMQ39031.1 hypothetical protein AO053_04235 [Haemophilus influenzae biotype aegyptius]TMQ39299.1 hypothetical protein AO051_03070 [Haemophilus influenzae biotype aegyptius]
MSILGSYLILNDKNIQKLQNEFNFGIDEIFHYSKNNALDLFIRIEKIESKKVKTEFNSDFELCGFVNSEKKDRFYNDFFKVADYNIDLQIDDEKDDVPFGYVYGLSDCDEQAKGKLSMIQFDGFIQIPSRTINETAQKIILDKFSSYRFLNNEFGDLNHNFGLNFDFPNNYLDVPTQYTYVLIEQLKEIIDFHQDEQLKKQSNDSIDSTELQAEKAKNTQLQAENESLKAELKAQQDRMAELEQKLQQSAVDSEPVLGNGKAYDVRERETHLLMIGALSNLLAGYKQSYQKGSNRINQSAISRGIEHEIIKLLQPETKTRTLDTIRPRIREALNLITKAE